MEQLKQALTTAPVLRIFDPDLPIRTEHDASKFAWAAILSQKHSDGKWHPVAFESRKFNPAQQNYDTANQEFLAVTESLKAWRHYLYGQTFEMITDHEALSYIPRQGHLSPRQIRAIELLSQYHYTITYRPGAKNIPADALSRRPDHWINVAVIKSEVHPVIPFAGKQETDINLQTAWKLAMSNVKQEEYWIINGILYRKGKLCVPLTMIKEVLQEGHDTLIGGHRGISKTYQAIKQSYWWAGMKEHVHNHVRECVVCQQKKTSTQLPQGKLQPIPPPNRIWEELTMDFAVSLPETPRKKTAVIIVVDRLSKQAHFIPTRDDNDAIGTAGLFSDNIVRYHGVP